MPPHFSPIPTTKGQHEVPSQGKILRFLLLKLIFFFFFLHASKGCYTTQSPTEKGTNDSLRGFMSYDSGLGF